MNRKDKARGRDLLKKFTESGGNLTPQAQEEFGRLCFNALSEVVSGSATLEPVKGDVEGVVAAYESGKLAIQAYVAELDKGWVPNHKKWEIKFRAILALFDAPPEQLAPSSEATAEDP